MSIAAGCCPARAAGRWPARAMVGAGPQRCRRGLVVGGNWHLAGVAVRDLSCPLRAPETLAAETQASWLLVGSRSLTGSARDPPLCGPLDRLPCSRTANTRAGAGISSTVRERAGRPKAGPARGHRRAHRSLARWGPVFGARWRPAPARRFVWDCSAEALAAGRAWPGVGQLERCDLALPARPAGDLASRSAAGPEALPTLKTAPSLSCR